VPGKLDRCPYEIQRGVCESGIFVRMRRCMKMKGLVESEDGSQTVAKRDVSQIAWACLCCAAQPYY
jgi:hypothetical protein